MQNYPNPFNPATTIEFTVGPAGPPAPGGMSAATTQVKLSVFDLLGREVAVLADGHMPPGKYAVRFEAGALASGVYLYSLQTNRMALSRRLLLLR